MTKRMLIDATHEEETRVAVIDNNRLEEYDYESSAKKPLKGSIFLAKVTRVEPSLQAAFVNFGGNRHGFLPFSEIHPDYFRIPVSDREALMAEQDAVLAEDEEDEEKEAATDAEKEKSKKSPKSKDSESSDDSEEEVVEQLGGEGPPDSEEGFEFDGAAEGGSVESDTDADVDAAEDEVDAEDSLGNRVAEGDIDDSDGNAVVDSEDDVDGNKDPSEGNSNNRHRNNNRGGRGGGRNRGGRNRGGRGRPARSHGGEKYGESEQSAEQRFRSNLRRKYKIQEVIKRGQIMLVQVNKEERGNKGAAVGSYLSLPGRYCVLMPNSPRAGGVSRKIANYKDRARMRELMKELDVPKGMSVILRTAGVARTKTEIKRDLDYLMRLWNNIRELTLESSAPSLVYEEADLIKRVVRDIYTREIEEIIVAGEEGYKNAKEFMKMMIPSHVKKVKEYKYKEEKAPLFTRYKVESQISEISEIQVTLPSGGYLVINPTEALVSIDVNSGRATKGRHIEETALKTNLETATEVARQLRLRDLGGLIVIDFIDMEDRRNNAKVERKMRDALSDDRARIQMGRISSFGLMELSRQRMNPSLSEAQSEVCSHCSGSGRVRTVDATAILVLRAIEDEGVKGRVSQLIVHVSNPVAQYVLNNKRQSLADLEARHGLTILIHVDDEIGGDHFRVEVSKSSEKSGSDKASGDGDSDSEAVKQSDNTNNSDGEDGQRKPRRRGRRGGRRRGRREEGAENEQQQNQGQASTDSPQGGVDEASTPAESKSESKPKSEDKVDDTPKASDKKKPAAKKVVEKDTQDEKPKKRVSKPKAKKYDKAEVAEKVEKVEKPKAKSAAVKKKSAPSNDDGPSVASEHETVNAAPKKKKRGWWSKDTD